ncbi:MAG: SDR family NAD(P)-dependent oxidoreductase [Acidobacteriia bacterium]|nr:SDR family NAD(P)-dependent oxidoreductase [Terriglobia bacterium]
MPADKTGKTKLAVITGGGSGIGLAMARTFARNGYSVVITGRNAKRLHDALSQLGKDQAQVTAIPCDVRDPASVEKLFQEIGKLRSTIDVLINNAGVAHTLAPVEKLPIETWKEVIDTNLTGTFLVTRAALPWMHAGATIVNNLSIAAVQPFPGMSAYNASKFGALGFTQALREDLRKRGIRVVALLPGATDTNIWGQFWADAPREKMISAETVAEAVLHAASAPANATIEEIRIGPAAGVL